MPSALHLSLNGMSYLVFVLGLMASGIDARRFYSELLNIGIIVVLAEIIVLYSNRLHYDHYRMTAMVERQNEKLTHYACYDSLTGLLNRRMIWKALQEAVDQGKPLCCVILDLDDFKRYNDTYGHLAGDDLLKWLGGLLERYAKKWQGAAGRYGGEEFLLVLPAMSEEKAVQCMERLLEDIHHLPGERPMSASAGGCMAFPGLELEKLVSRADKALYLAKCTGKDRFELYRN